MQKRVSLPENSTENRRSMDGGSARHRFTVVVISGYIVMIAVLGCFQEAAVNSLPLVFTFLGVKPKAICLCSR